MGVCNVSQPSSPLRYPGGKSGLYGLMSQILRLNNLAMKRYAEPFAGGCGLALELLFQGDVSEIHINDIDSSIWAFWHSVLDHPQDLVSAVQNTPVTIEEWHRQREIHKRNDLGNPLELGFSAFFLNRTNRSGIIKNAGVIGGLSQSGQYKLDCRFNRDALQRRILRISKYRRRIHLSKMDAIEFIRETDSTQSGTTFYCIDPPYFLKGAGLYTSHYKPDDHKELADFLLTREQPWIVTYDNVEQISMLYKTFLQYDLNVKYSLQKKRIGKELLVASRHIKLPPDFPLNDTETPNSNAA